MRVYSSYGVVRADPVTGLVQSCEIDKTYDGPTYLQNIARFDVEEYRRTYPDEDLQDVDIATIAFWTRQGEYSEADHEYRQYLLREQQLPLKGGVVAPCLPTFLDAAGLPPRPPRSTLSRVGVLLQQWWQRRTLG